MVAGSGKCLCGAVRISAETVDIHHHACHCATCRKWASGPYFAASATGVSIEGEENVTVYDSSPWAQRGFCKICGSNLFYRLKETGIYSISVGIFDRPDNFSLGDEYFIDEKPGGYAFAGERPRKTGAELFAEHTPPD